MSYDRPIQPGDRVSVRGSIPKSYGRPLAVVVSLGPVCAKVRLFGCGSEFRIPHEELRLTTGQIWIDEHPEKAFELGLIPQDVEALEPAVELELEELVEEEPELPVVVISCGGAKASAPAPASELSLVMAVGLGSSSGRVSVLELERFRARVWLELDDARRHYWYADRAGAWREALEDPFGWCEGLEAAASDPDNVLADVCRRAGLLR